MKIHSYVIAFNLFDKASGKFEKMYFRNWNGQEPHFVDKKRAKHYFGEKQAQEDLEKLKQVRSNQAITLNVRVEESE